MKYAYNEARLTTEAKQIVTEIEGVLHKVCEIHEGDWDMASLQLLFYEAVGNTFMHRRAKISYAEPSETEKIIEKINLFCDMKGGSANAAEALRYDINDFQDLIDSQKFDRIQVNRLKTLSKRIDAHIMGKYT